MHAILAGVGATLVAGACLATPGSASLPPANGPSGDAAISGDGRFVAFSSDASNLVRGDTNGVFDVFVRDRSMRRTERVSLASDGAEANGRTGLAAISADGRFVVLWSEASNLVPGDTNDAADVFVRDRLARTTERVSVRSDGGQANGASAHGAITPDGRFVAFASTASNLASGDADTEFDVFVRDRAAGRTEHAGAGWAPALSADGRYVAFERRRANPGIVVHDRTRGSDELASMGIDGAPAGGLSAVPTISADGRFVAFVSEASNLVRDDRNGGGRAGADVFVRDRLAGTTELASIAPDGTQANGASSNPKLSADGRAVAFTSGAPNLAPVESGGSVVLRDLDGRRTELVSVSVDGGPANGSSYTGSGPLGTEGRAVAYFSLASNLVAGDRNEAYDVFVRDRTSRRTDLVSVARARLQAGRVTLKPSRPRAGRPVTATLAVTFEGRPVAEAVVTCIARIRGRALPVASSSFRASRARCVWRVPRSAKGGTLIGSISVATADGVAAGRFAAGVLASRSRP